MEVELDDLPSSQLAVPSIGVREATDLIRMVSVSGRVGWGGGGGGSHRLALCQLRSKVIQSYK